MFKNLKLSFIALVFCFIVFNCKNEQPTEQAIALTQQRLRQQQPVDTAVYYSSLLDSLCLLQDSIYIQPKDTALRSHYRSLSFDSINGTFRVVGKGVFNREFPESGQIQSRKTAATFVGKRWALYCKLWHTGSRIAFGKPVQGEIMYSSTLAEKDHGDTLYILLEIPIGSVVVP